MTTPLGYPAAPTNGGPLEYAPEKIGDWVWQPKIDDWRGVAQPLSGRVWNQYGAKAAVAAQGKLAQALEELNWHSKRGDFEWFDIGIMENRHDMMRGAIILFDVMDTTLAHRERRLSLEAIFPVLPMASRLLANGNVRGGVYLINEWPSCLFPQPYPFTPLALQELLQRENAKIGRKFYEGLVAKRQDAMYPLGLKPKQVTPMWVKHRFDQ